MIDHLFVTFILILGVFTIFVVCNVACEYRNYSTGHRYIRAFEARGKFQSLFTVLQRESDVSPWDRGKITYIGYMVAIICTVTAVGVIPFSIAMYFINPDVAIKAYSFWFSGCFLLGIAAFLLQLMDSLLNFVLEVFNK